MTRRPAALLLCALALAGCARKRSAGPDAAVEAAPAPILPPDPEAARWNWTATSRDGHVTLTQSSANPHLCQLTCVKEPGQQLWTASACLGTVSKTYLVSDDGERILAVDPAPKTTGSWRAAALVTAHQRGEPRNQILAADLFPDEKKLVLFPDSLQWLAGSRQVPFPPPRFVEGAPDQVELTLIDERKTVVSLDGTILSGARPIAPPPVAKQKPRKRK